MQVFPKDALQVGEIDSSDEEKQMEEDMMDKTSGKTEKDTQIVSDLIDGVNLIAGQNRGFY